MAALARRLGRRRLFAALAALALAAVAVAVVVGVGGGDSAPTASARNPLPPTDEVAARVERIRGLRFETRPRVEVVSEAQLGEAFRQLAQHVAQEQGRKRIERSQRAAGAAFELLLLAGVLKSEQELKGLERELGGRLRGLYVPHQERVLLPRDNLNPDPRRNEIVVAHELTHALEDQHFGTFETAQGPLQEQAAARQALIEGTASLAHARYASEHLGAEGPVARQLARTPERTLSADVPRAIKRSLAFPYAAGARFAKSLHERGGWPLLNRAHRRPPATTEQILHPRKWLAGERATRPRLRVSRPGEGWARIGGGDFGEFDTSLLLEAGVDARTARRAAAGWAGGRFEVWHNEAHPAGGCPAPCRADTAAVLAWRWDTPDDADQFSSAVSRYLAGALDGRRTASRVWSLEGGAAALASGSGTASALSFAADARTARRLARDAARGAAEDRRRG